MSTTELELCFSAMSGVFPGAESTDALWERIIQADIAPLTDLTERWNIQRDVIYSSEKKTLNKIYLDKAHCLEIDQDGFASFWGRQTQITKNVLENLIQQAHLDPDDSKTKTALVIGTSWSDESYFMVGSQYDQNKEWFDLTDYEKLAKSLGINGPVITVDTACSSFAYAIDSAKNIIQSGQANRAIVAGVNAFLPPSLFLGFSQLGAFSASEALRPFSETSDGLVPGECVAAFLLEPLNHTLTSSNRKPLALLKGLGISSDGAEGSIFSPGKLAQINAYKRAYKNLNPLDIDYIEAHGTGTPVGDSTELESLHTFFKSYFEEKNTRLPIGSIKSIIGHTLAASGAASLAKALLMLSHKKIPPHISVQQHSFFEKSCLDLPQQAIDFPKLDRNIRIGISSFGFGGANAHVIIEEANYCIKKNAELSLQDKPKKLDLAITQCDANFAVAPSNIAWQKLITSQKIQSASTFPDRFKRIRQSQKNQSESLHGHFFKGKMPIDIANFRMGPKQLSYVDSFKLLVAYRTKVMLSSAQYDDKNTAMVMCANMGGEHFFDLYHKLDHYLDANCSEPPNIVVDDVGSMLPTMISGYPTRVLDLKGFHQTLSGEAGIFWNAFKNAPFWLKDSCKTLVLGAGHYLNCVADSIRANSSVEHGEGIGLFVVKSYEQALQNKEQILARVSYIIEKNDAENIEQACALAEKSLSTLDVQICELSPNNSHTSLVNAQKITGFMGEATGVESLAAAIYAPKLQHVIEVRSENVPQFWVFIEKDQHVNAIGDPEIKLLQEIQFSLTDQDNQKKESSEVLTNQVDLPKIEEMEVTNKIHVQPNLTISELHDVIFDSLQTHLALQMKVIEKLKKISNQESTLPNRIQEIYSPYHRLIESYKKDATGMSALLIVNEHHSYFFDHALDHVPGVLLLAGILQLVEVYKADQNNAELFIHQVDIQFKRYAEKNSPIQISLKHYNSMCYEIEVTQNHHILCLCTVKITENNKQFIQPNEQSFKPCVKQNYLHKSIPENILVSDLNYQNQDAFVMTCPIPLDHYFSQGNPKSLSMIYFLEVARQCFMLLAHEMLDIPTGTPMNLIQLSFSLNTPISRNSSFKLVPHHELKKWSGLMQTGEVDISLQDATREIGRAKITSQVINKEIYAMQRKNAHEKADA